MGLPRRPRMAEAGPTAIIAGLLLGLFAKDWRAGLAGGAVTAVLANRSQPLDFAVRNYLEAQGFNVINYYRAPRMFKVTFSFGPHAYWTVESLMPEGIQLGN